MAYDRISSTETIFERRESRVRSYCRAFPEVFRSASGSEMITEDGTR